MEYTNPETENQNPEEAEAQKKKPSTALKVVVLIVLVILLVAGILLPIKLVPNAFSSLGATLTSIFKPNAKVTLSTSTNDIRSSDPFTLTWTGDHKTNGSYSLSYPCIQGVHLETSINQARETITCGSSYYFSPNDNSVDLTAFSDINRFVDIPVTLGFLPNSSASTETLGVITLTVTNTNLSNNTDPIATSTPSTQEPVTPNTPAEEPSTPVKPTPSGKADLEVRLAGVGYINRSTGAFIQSNTIPQGERAAIHFQVQNVGSKATGVWTLRAVLPSKTDPFYESATQKNLNPGDLIDYTLGFENIHVNGNRIATVYADPSNLIAESNESNNSKSVDFGSSGSPVSTGGNPDLTVRVLATGYIDRSTNTFYPSAYVNPGNRAAVRFEVTNAGGSTSNAWTFKADLPTSTTNNQTYYSGNNAGLASGQSVIFTIGFDEVRSQGGNTVGITIDPQNYITETNEGNNYTTATINRS